MITIRDLQDEFSRLVPQPLMPSRNGQSPYPASLMREVVLFRERLNSLGAKNIFKIPPGACRNIDQTVAVTAGQATELRQEMQRLQRLLNGRL